MRIYTRTKLPARQLPIEWSDGSWPVSIRQSKLGAASAALAPHGCSRAKVIDRTEGQAGFGRAHPRALTLAHPTHQTDFIMRTHKPSAHRFRRGYTLIELLVVIAIITILAGMLLPTLGGVKTKAKAKLAKTEMHNLATAIQSYESEYSRMPLSELAEKKPAPSGDFTFGTSGIVIARLATDPSMDVLNGGGYEANDSELMMILVDMDYGVNANHARNPRKLALFNAKPCNGPDPGLSVADKVLRDPWGTPYMITLDFDGNNKCIDPIYRKLDGAGLTLNSAGDLELNGPVMIWSFGPDKKFDPNPKVPPGTPKAKVSYNRDNILSWQ